MATYFDALKIGDLELPNRIIMPPLTRARSTRDGVPVDIMAKYYSQRATAGLIISEGTYVNKNAVGFELVPGVYNKEQVEAWKPITAAVHDAGGRIFCQLWHCGRVGATYIMGGNPPLSPSGVNDDLGVIDPYAKLENGSYVKIAPTPSRPMTLDDIKRTVDDYAQAGANATEAGFDGVEIHAANGYLPNQFLCERLNTPDDAYGGSVEDRSRFIVEIFEAISQHLSAGTIGIRFSPYALYNNARPSDPHEIYSYLAGRMEKFGAAYIHFADMNGWFGSPDLEKILEALRPNYSGPIIANGGITTEQGAEFLAKGRVQAISFGRGFFANPDLVTRIKNRAPIVEAPAGGWYSRGEHDYTDFPTMDLANA
jgi:2,4-dienoyl-CoA reductase-like NADH-dependent reductase (Old Yellow Enzyme family)